MSRIIHATAIVSPKAELGDHVEIGPYCQISDHVQINDEVVLRSHCIIDGHTTIGKGNHFYPFCVIGSAPQHLGHKGEPTKLVIGERNQVREHVTMHTGTAKGTGVTTVGNDCLFMVASHVAHDCVVGNNVVMANNCSLGGHVEVGDFVFLGGLSGIHQFARIGRYAFVGGAAMVTKDVIPYGSVWGNHARLEGLNLVGLKRRGFDRDLILHLRTAYRIMFADEGTLQERLDDVLESYGKIDQIKEIVDFIRQDSTRPICLPSDK